LPGFRFRYHGLKTADFHYSLPAELIAQAPLAQRSASRLLVVPPAPLAFVDQHICDLPQWLRPGDLVVLNNTKVIAARLFGHKLTGGRVEILLERLLGEQRALAQIRASKAPKPGTEIKLEAGGFAHVVQREGAFYILDFSELATTPLDTPLPLANWLEHAGQLPLPPYIQRAAHAEDRLRYQTVFAREPGAVAAPTAGLHFDQMLLEALQQQGVQTAYLTLHVGAGTFQPVRSDYIHEHVMHSEWCEVSADVVDQIHRTRAKGGRVIAVGTTVVRALESATQEGTLQPFTGNTQIFITPGYAISSVDALLTNFHLPESTLLMLVAAFAGKQRIFTAYQHAINQRYRFFSYGDAMLLFPATAA